MHWDKQQIVHPRPGPITPEEGLEVLLEGLVILKDLLLEERKLRPEEGHITHGRLSENAFLDSNEPFEVGFRTEDGEHYYTISIKREDFIKSFSE